MNKKKIKKIISNIIKLVKKKIIIKLSLKKVFFYKRLDKLFNFHSQNTVIKILFYFFVSKSYLFKQVYKNISKNNIHRKKTY